MLRFHRWSIRLCLGVIWWLSTLKLVSLFTTNAGILHCIGYLPVYALGMLGVYSIITIAVNVLVIADCPQAAKELEKEIQNAKHHLQKRGFDFEA
uniref:Dolichol-phosphate mannosyltransferase subunit 3 n=1 Tax=Albugo laibachii Nc14 TaxID=890382 RepID=F0WD66_9STRA|nr:AlNc14C64G4586 [Albugo laibachii Nc14]|eukprot:CCA19138.1 AlNc14C64G4586 [Albugo laibachii Nc14]